MSLNYETSLKLHPINIREDKKNFIVEDQITGEFFEMPAICIYALEMIENGASLHEIEKELKAAYPEEEVNLLEFAQQLWEMDLIQEVDGQPIESAKRKQKNHGFLWIPQRMAKIFFNRFAMCFYSILFLVNIGIFISNPHLIPHYKDLFVFDVMTINILIYFAISLLLVLVHEFGHVMALRSVGLPTKVEIGHRLILVVLETDMSEVWGLPAKKRNVLYLAGLCFDNVILFLALLADLLFPGQTGVVLGISGMIVLDVVIRMIYQCFIYMKTDLYYVLENLTGCYNLLENSRTYFRELIFSTKGKSTPAIFAGEKPVVITYGIFYMIGMGITFTLFVTYFIPQLIYIVKESIHCVMRTSEPAHFWDGAIVLLQLLLTIGLLLYSWGKSYILKTKGQL
ncbi:hypothetical protein [Neobacillus sp. LXY-4]|uniref:hypothetical protein n=1 Tax=Neobacillus sp. LXY-4 TaxID=3379826 RepID=UPI003EE014B5